LVPQRARCLTCPFYGDGLGFVPDESVKGAAVVVLLQNPGADEEVDGKPAVGATGNVLDTMLLPRAGLTRGVNVQVGNALRCRYEHTNNLPKGKLTEEALAKCRQYDNFPPETRLIVACGDAAWKAFKGPGSIQDWRGFLKPNDS